MKLFLDTAQIDAIKKWAQTGILDGVTTNPSHLSKQGGEPKKTVQEICALLPQGDISIEVTQTSPEDVYKQAKMIAALANNVVVKIPCHADYYQLIHTLAREGVRLNITLVFTLIQGMLMSKLGAEYISPFVGRLEDKGQDGTGLLYQMQTMVQRYNFKTVVLAASLRNLEHVHEAIAAGVGAMTVPVELLEKMVVHPLTDAGIEKFNADWAKLGIKQFP